MIDGDDEGGVIFLFLAGFSRLWLARFRFGPAEWLWRALSYGAFQPLAREREGPAAAFRPARGRR